MARVNLLRNEDGTGAFHWSDDGTRHTFDYANDDSIAIAFTKAVNDGIEAGDEIEGEAAQAVAEILKAGDVVWDSEAAVNDWREDICAQLPASNYAEDGGPSARYYYVDDITLDGRRVLICGNEGGDSKAWVAEVTENNGDPVLSPRATWVEVQEQYVSKAGRKFSQTHYEAMQQAHSALGKLIDVARGERGMDDEEAPKTTKAFGDDDHEMSYSVTKAEGAMRYTLGPLYAPMRKDAHGEYVDDDVLHKSLHEFVRDSAESGRRLNLQHGDKGDSTVGEWVEAVRWPYDHVIKMQHPTTGEETEVEMPAGTVYLGVVWDEDYWDVEKNAPKGLNGYSLGGRAVKVRDDSATLKDMGYRVRKSAEAPVTPPAAPAVQEAPVVKETTAAGTEDAGAVLEMTVRTARAEGALSERREADSLLGKALEALKKDVKLGDTHIHLPEQNITLNQGVEDNPLEALVAPPPEE